MDEKLIIWDWNGTLLNDVEYCTKTINIVLERYNLKQITVPEYRDLFCFPVKEYYRNIGFDFSVNPFEKVGMEYIELYNKNLNTCKLHDEALSTIKALKQKGVKQVLISARFQDALTEDVKLFGLTEYFNETLGINDNYASSKEYLFEKYLSENNYKKENITLVGDTIHDCEIAAKFGLNFLLLEKGHQSDIHFKNCNNLQKIKCLTEIFEKI